MFTLHTMPGGPAFANTILPFVHKSKIIQANLANFLLPRVSFLLWLSFASIIFLMAVQPSAAKFQDIVVLGDAAYYPNNRYGCIPSGDYQAEATLLGNVISTTNPAIVPMGSVADVCAFVWSDGTTATAGFCWDATGTSGEVGGTGPAAPPFSFPGGAWTHDIQYGLAIDSAQPFGNSYMDTEAEFFAMDEWVIPPNTPAGGYNWSLVISGGTARAFVTYESYIAPNVVVGGFTVEWNSTMSYIPGPLDPGDANGDGTVDVNDLTIVLTNFGQSYCTRAQGEFTGDGTIDINDLTMVLANYNTTYGASSALNAVPEASSIALVAIGAVSLLAFAWRKRRAS